MSVRPWDSVKSVPAGWIATPRDRFLLRRSYRRVREAGMPRRVAHVTVSDLFARGYQAGHTKGTSL